MLEGEGVLSWRMVVYRGLVEVVWKGPVLLCLSLAVVVGCVGLFSFGRVWEGGAILIAPFDMAGWTAFIFWCDMSAGVLLLS